jgi:hypothetical protein
VSWSPWGRRWSWNRPDLHPRLRRTMGPTRLPLELSEIVAHLRLDPGAETGPEQALLTGMLTAAVGLLQRHCTYAIMTQDWLLTLHAWPPGYTGLELPYPPFAELVSVTLSGGPVPVNQFIVEPDDRFPAVMYPVGGHWPTNMSSTWDSNQGGSSWDGGAADWDVANLTPGPLAVGITFRCGREDPADIDPDIKQALLLAIATWYENRESSTQFTLTPMVQTGWDALLVAYRQLGFA